MNKAGKLYGPSTLDAAVYREESEERQRVVWTKESLERAVKEAEARKERLPSSSPMWADAVRGVADAQSKLQAEAPVTRSDILQEAITITEGARQQAYDGPEENFTRIARHWIVFFKNRFDIDVALTPADVALIMDLMKTARLEFNPKHRDSWVDKAGYSACGAVCALNMVGG